MKEIIKNINLELLNKPDLQFISAGQSDLGNWFIDTVAGAICSVKKFSKELWSHSDKIVHPGSSFQ